MSDLAQQPFPGFATRLYVYEVRHKGVDGHVPGPLFNTRAAARKCRAQLQRAARELEESGKGVIFGDWVIDRREVLTDE